MILVVDVGNTNIVLGIYEGTEAASPLAAQHEPLRDGGRVRHDDSQSVSSCASVKLDQIEGVIISSVVPPLMRTLEQLCQQIFAQGAA